jgi:hypothetical protein
VRRPRRKARRQERQHETDDDPDRAAHAGMIAAIEAAGSW